MNFIPFKTLYVRKNKIPSFKFICSTLFDCIIVIVNYFKSLTITVMPRYRR